MSSTPPLLEVRDLAVSFEVRPRSLLRRRPAQHLRAVDGVSLTVARGETLALVGESGCGKSTTGRAILQLVRPTRGSVRLDGVELTELDEHALRPLRRRMQIVFQDPYASLDPRMTVFDIVAEPLREHDDLGRAELAARVDELLGLVGLEPAVARRYPHQFSGGQRQRVGIARALALSPELLVCDEPTSALDVSVQAQVLNLLSDLRSRFDLAMIFISHDLATVRHIAQRVAVMYLGRIVELADRDAIYSAAAHPYTRALLAAAPLPDPAREAEREHVLLRGELPSPLDPPSGCAFHPRCPLAAALCERERPALEALDDGAASSSRVACHAAHGKLADATSQPPSESQSQAVDQPEYK